MQKYAQRGSPNPGAARDERQYQSRPATAQTIRNAHDHDHVDTHDAFGTDTGSFDATRTSLDDQDPMTSDDQQVEDDVEYRDDEGYAERDGEMYQLYRDDLVDMVHEMNQKGYLATGMDLANSYPPTTSGEPDWEGEPEVHHEQRPRTEEPHDAHGASAPQHKILEARIPMVRSERQVGPEQFKVPPPATTRLHRATYQQRPREKTPTPFRDASKPHARVSTLKQAVAFYDPAPQRKPDPPKTPTHEQVFPASQAKAPHQVQDHVTEYDQQPDTEVNDLDYEPDELFRKDFASLQKDPFDGPKREDPGNIPSNIDSLPLEQKLAEVSKHNVDDQRRFFASLAIDQWEEAGDWFQERFSEVLDHLKEARKERRRLAHEFEHEISKREQALVRKRKITEDALSAMKASGALVLQGTPQKKHKTMR